VKITRTKTNVTTKLTMTAIIMYKMESRWDAS